MKIIELIFCRRSQVKCNFNLSTGTGVKRLIVTLFLVVSIIHGYGQGKISGIVLNKENQPLADASVLLLNAKDSSLVKGTISSKKGEYSFSKISAGTYFIASSFVNYRQSYSDSISISGATQDINVPSLKLSENENTLEKVTVEKKKPLVEALVDRLVLNVGGSITSAGGTALQILERSPGVVVNRQNNTIAMIGKEGVRVMINGKLNYMPASTVVQLLDGMSAGNIEKIELITTPPANFDAEGNAGYINIVLKQNNNLGTNGSFSATQGYGKGWVTQASMNFNHRMKKLNIYGDFSYSRSKSMFPNSEYNRVSNNGDIYEAYANGQRSDTTRTHTARLGLDYQLTRRMIVGILFTSNGRWYRQAERTNATFNLNGHRDTTATSNNSEFNNWQDYGINLNLQQQLKKGNNLAFNASHLHYKNNQPFNYYSRYYDKKENLIYDETFRNHKLTPLNFWIGAIDYAGKMSEKINLEAGIKGTLADFRNNLVFERLIQSNWVRDDALSSTYTLKENYSAVYVSLNITASAKTSIKGGLRYEYTNSNLGSETEKNIVDRHYGKLFPTLYLSHKLNENNAFSLSYSSRITRPKFNDLAPFIYYNNRNSVLAGNAALQPAISHAVSAGYTFKKYFLQIAFTKEDNTITGFQPKVDSASNKTTFRPENLDNQKLVTVVLSIPVTVTIWWSMQYNITGIWQQVNAVYEKEPMTIEQKNIRFNMTQSFKLPRHFSMELSGFYNSRSLDGIMIFKPMGSLDFGIRKSLGVRDNLNFSASNLLNSMDFRGYTRLPEKNLVGDIHLRFSWRTYKLTYTRNFGKQKLKASRSRITGAEDEKGRVKY